MTVKGNYTNVNRNITKTLDAMKAVLLKEYKKRQAAQKNKDEKR